MDIQTFTMLNGNDQEYTRSLPKLVIISKYFNEVALERVRIQTGLTFTKTHFREWEAQPETFEQFFKLFACNNFKTQYNDNSCLKNTILLKFQQSEGFKVDSICYNCMEANRIHIGDSFQPEDRLSV